STSNVSSGTASPATACSAARMSACAPLGSKRALIRTFGQSGVVPGVGSNTGVSSASSNVSELAPAANSASSNGAGSAEPMVNVTCRKGMAAERSASSLDVESSLQVVNVETAALERGVIENFLMYRDVGL